jgi:hypothetical protein
MDAAAVVEVIEDKYGRSRVQVLRGYLETRQNSRLAGKGRCHPNAAHRREILVATWASPTALRQRPANQQLTPNSF